MVKVEAGKYWATPSQLLIHRVTLSIKIFREYAAAISVLPVVFISVCTAEERTISADDMVSLHQMGTAGLSVSPDGNSVSFQMHQANLARNNYEAGWYTLDLTRKTESPVRVGSAGDPRLFKAKNIRGNNRINGAWSTDRPIWSPDSQWIAYRRMDGDSVQIWRSRRDGAISERLTDHEADVDAVFWSDNGQQIWFETDASRTEKAKHMQSKWEDGMWIDTQFFHPMSQTYTPPPYFLTSGQPRLWVLDLGSKQVRAASDIEIRRNSPVTSATANRDFARVDASRTVSLDGTRLAWKELDSEGRDQIRARLDHKSRNDIRCELDGCRGSIGALWWSGDGRELLFWREMVGLGELRAWNVHNNSVRTVYASKTRHLSACSSTGRSLICFSDRPNYPRTLVEVQFSDGSLTDIYDPNPQMDEISFGEAEPIEWHSEMGAETFGWIIKPVGYEPGKRYPLVILQYHASACFKGGSGDEFPSQLLAAEGFVVLCVDRPSSRPKNRSFVASLNFIASTLDSAIDVLDEKGLIDPSRVGVTGLSSGWAAIAYGLSHPNRYSAVIGASFEWGLSSYYFAGSPEDRARLGRFGLGRPGTPSGTSWSEVSPGLNPNTVNVPVLIQVSEDEARGAMFNYVTLQEEGKPIDMYVFRDDYHNKWYPRNKRAVAVRAVDWMSFWLKGEVDGDPTKTEQFGRWRDLCKQHIANLQGADDPELRRRGEKQPCEQTLH